MMELKMAMAQAGIVGAGGAGFPSFMKLASGADTLIVNGAECEPLLYTDYVILRDEIERITRGCRYVMEETGIKQAYIGIKKHNLEKLPYHNGDEIARDVFIKELPNVYPMGDEISLIYEVTHRVVRPGNLPISAGCIVYNAETMYNICRCVEEDRKVVEKWCMVGGDIEKPFVCKVPVGTFVKDLFKFYHIEIPEGDVLVDGGPSMGSIVNPDLAVVKKNTKSLLILPSELPAIRSKQKSVNAILAHCSSNCCQCTRCTDLCPRHLLGYPLEPHKMVRSAVSAAEKDPELVKTASLCCGCGICEIFACCQGISPKGVIGEYKKILAKNKMRYVADGDVTPREDREYRMVPSSRWASALGVTRFDKRADLVDVFYKPNRVKILMSQHIGAPSIPTCQIGDKVEVGTQIAKAAEGLSLPQYASIEGVITSVSEKEIIIERG